MSRLVRLLALALSTLGGLPRLASAQPAGAPAPGAQAAPVVERPGVGVVFGVSDFGPVGALRLSAPVGARAGVDLDIGKTPGMATAGPFVAGQVRVLFHPRQPAPSRNGYFIARFLYLPTTTGYGIEFPGEPLIEVTTVHPFAFQIGVGRDRMATNGVHTGIELLSGSSSGGEPVVFLTGYVRFGPRR